MMTKHFTNTSNPIDFPQRMQVYVVYYVETIRGREGPETDRYIHGVYSSVEKAEVARKALEASNRLCYAYVDTYEVK